MHRDAQSRGGSQLVHSADPLAPATSVLQRNRRRVIHQLLTSPDTTGNAIRCNAGQGRAKKPAYLCGICKPVQTPATTDRTLVKRLGQRFESAPRLPHSSRIYGIRAINLSFRAPFSGEMCNRCATRAKTNETSPLDNTAEADIRASGSFSLAAS